MCYAGRLASLEGVPSLYRVFGRLWAHRAPHRSLVRPCHVPPKNALQVREPCRERCGRHRPRGVGSVPPQRVVDRGNRPELPAMRVLFLLFRIQCVPPTDVARCVVEHCIAGVTMSYLSKERAWSSICACMTTPSRQALLCLVARGHFPARRVSFERFFSRPIFYPCSFQDISLSVCISPIVILYVFLRCINFVCLL